MTSHKFADFLHSVNPSTCVKSFIKRPTALNLFNLPSNFSDSLNTEEEETTSESFNDNTNEQGSNDTDNKVENEDDLETASNPDEEVEIPDVDDQDAQTEEKSKHTEL